MQMDLMLHLTALHLHGRTVPSRQAVYSWAAAREMVKTLMKQTRMGIIVKEPTRSKMGEVIGSLYIGWSNILCRRNEQ